MKIASLQATGTGGRQAPVDKMYGNIYDHFAIRYEYENSVQGFSFSHDSKPAVPIEIQ
ncbi:MAG: hypothetical protein IPO25_23245 [Saprospiraceae bacterium]|nr:hypothetical protein [Saprospiraceae bacterium]